MTPLSVNCRRPVSGHWQRQKRRVFERSDTTLHVHL